MTCPSYYDRKGFFVWCENQRRSLLRASEITMSYVKALRSKENGTDYPIEPRTVWQITWIANGPPG